MPHMTDERVRAGVTHSEDLSLPRQISVRTAGISHFEICHPLQDVQPFVFPMEIVH